MKTLKDVWESRFKLINLVPNNVSVKPGFDISNGINSNLTYSSDNYMDPTIDDLRSLLQDFLFDNTVPPGMTSQDVSVNGDTIKILSNDDITIVTPYSTEQPQFTFYMGFYKYSMSWYKRRGRIDSFINLEYGDPITLESVTDILVALKLETDVEFDEY